MFPKCNLRGIKRFIWVGLNKGKEIKKKKKKKKKK